VFDDVMKSEENYGCRQERKHDNCSSSYNCCNHNHRGEQEGQRSYQPAKNRRV